MTTEAMRAISFECEECGEIQFADYTLVDGWYMGRAVNEDNIICEHCWHDQHVIEEL